MNKTNGNIDVCPNNDPHIRLLEIESITALKWLHLIALKLYYNKWEKQTHLN